MTYLISPESQQQFFKATDDVLSAAEAYKFMTPIFGKGVVYDAPTETMIEQVKLARGGLTAEKLRSYVSKMVKEAETFFSTVAPNIGDKGQIDLIQVTLLVHACGLMYICICAACDSLLPT